MRIGVKHTFPLTDLLIIKDFGPSNRIPQILHHGGQHPIVLYENDSAPLNPLHYFGHQFHHAGHQGLFVGAHGGEGEG